MNKFAKHMLFSSANKLLLSSSSAVARNPVIFTSISSSSTNPPLIDFSGSIISSAQPGTWSSNSNTGEAHLLDNK